MQSSTTQNNQPIKRVDKCNIKLKHMIIISFSRVRLDRAHSPKHNARSNFISIQITASSCSYKDKHKPKANILQFHYTVMECIFISFILLQIRINQSIVRYLFASWMKVKTMSLINNHWLEVSFQNGFIRKRKMAAFSHFNASLYSALCALFYTLCETYGRFVLPIAIAHLAAFPWPLTLTPVFSVTPGQHCVLLLYHLSPRFHYPRMHLLLWTKRPFSWVTVSFGRVVIGYLLPLWPRWLRPNGGCRWPCGTYPPVATVNHWQWLRLTW